MNLDIPLNDIECWERYPKQHWVYELSRLLDAQNIKWSPFKTEVYTKAVLNIDLHHSNILPAYDNAPGYIYIIPDTDPTLCTEVYIIKGEVKFLHHINNVHNTVVGEAELRINAFVTLYFQKFTGVITLTTVKNNIYAVSLKPSTHTHTSDTDKLIKKIYKKSEEVSQEPAVF